MNAEPSPKGNPYLAARRAQKAALLPRAAELAAEGRSYQEIGAALGIAKSTICNWLRDRPLGRAAARSLGTPRMTAKLAARYESLYQRALREWNRSRTDRRTQTVVTSEPADVQKRGQAPREDAFSSGLPLSSSEPVPIFEPCRPTIKTTVRTEPRIGSAACLGKALAATQAMEGLHSREQARLEWLASESGNAAGNDDYLTQRVKTTLTRSGRKARTVVTTRLDAEHLASPTNPLVPSGGTWCPDALKDAAENRRIPEARLDADEHAATHAAAEETRAAMEAEGTAATERLLTAAARLAATEHAADRESTSVADHEYVAPASGFDVASPAATPANAGPARNPQDWRKSFLPNDLRLQQDEFSSVSRSATVPNDTLQRGGKGRGKAKDLRREAGTPAKRNRDHRPAGAPTAQAQTSGRKAGAADSLARELDLALGPQGPSPASVGTPFRYKSTGQKVG